MTPHDDRPIHGELSAAIRLVDELDQRSRERAIDPEELRRLVAWYLFRGSSRRIPRPVIERELTRFPMLQAIAVELDDIDLLDGRPLTEFVLGQHVEVILNGRNTTFHRGTIRSVVWHHKEQAWMYLLDENGRRLSRRYEARDLKAV